MIGVALSFLMQAAAPPAQAVTAFTNVQVLTMEDSRLRRQQTVVVSGGVVIALGPSGLVVIPANARRIDGGGRMVLAPGLTDAHVHLEADPESWLPLFLAHGITTVFNLRGDSSALLLRERVRRGEVLGPTIYTAGPYTNLPAIVTGADADTAVVEHRRLGFDFIKIHGNLHDTTFARLAASARAAGIPLIGHAPRNLPFSAVIAERQPLVAHLEELLYTRFTAYDTAGIGDVARQMAAAGVWVTPTLWTFSGIASQWGRPDNVTAVLATPAAQRLPRVLRDYWVRQNPYTGRSEGSRAFAERGLAAQRLMIPALQAAGVGLLAGTDTPLPVMVPGTSLHDEMEALAAAGLSRFDAIAAATANPGRWIARHVTGAEPFGRVAVGQRADLVLLEGNPLDSLGWYRHPAGTMVRGRWIPRDSLRQLADSVPAVAARRAAAPADVVRLGEDQLRRFTGRFATPEGRNATVTLVEGHLELNVPGQAPFVMAATSDSTFRLVNSVTGLSVAFSGGPDLIRVIQGGRPVMEARRTGP